LKAVGCSFEGLRGDAFVNIDIRVTPHRQLGGSLSMFEEEGKAYAMDETAMMMMMIM